MYSNNYPRSWLSLNQINPRVDCLWRQFANPCLLASERSQSVQQSSCHTVSLRDIFLWKAVIRRRRHNGQQQQKEEGCPQLSGPHVSPREPLKRGQRHHYCSTGHAGDCRMLDFGRQALKGWSLLYHGNWAGAMVRGYGLWTFRRCLGPVHKER